VTADDFRERPHRRWNPLLQEWLLVSPHRTNRPWLGHLSKPSPLPQLRYDPTCYLCPGNERAQGARNAAYQRIFVFDNDYAALLPDNALRESDDQGLIAARTERGLCRVICFTPRHDLAIPRMTTEEIRPVVDAWVEQYLDLGSHPWIRHVQIFENRGAIMGTSNPHPHCQVWANAELPNVPAREQSAQIQYHQQHRACLLCAYLEMETKREERMVCENAEFVALVPYWAVWPFEVLVLSRRHLSCMANLSDAERTGLADLLRRITIRYDNVFETAFPYSMGFHQQPTDGEAHPEWHFHAHYFPPLLRSATVQKFMVGYELLAMPQRDITAEAAAARLRDSPEIHYLDRRDV
jgi:UDPglucose--hexose-1-phosphate uridylyltransferase